MIFYSTADQTYNTTAPTGALAGSGWQWVGYWGAFQGTPIGPHHFLAARHIGGNVGDSFTYGGVNYTTTAYYDDTASDLRIWEVVGTFPSWASIYRTSDEVGNSLVVFGRGLSRGTPVMVNGSLAGWQWGSGTGPLRWGVNTVVSVEDGGSYWGSLLYALFQASDDPNEADLATYDSSGPVFINDGSGWKLAGVAAAVDGPFNTSTTGDGFLGAIFDARGLYFGGPGNWQLITGSSPVPTGFYATQVSARAAWIDSIVPPACEATDTPLLSDPEKIVLLVMIGGVGAFALGRRVA